MHQTKNLGLSAFRDNLQRMRPVTKDLSIVFGCFNASRYIEGNILDLVHFLDTQDRSYELLVIEDGSHDNSLEILRHLEKKLSNLTVLRNPKNMGKGYSIRNGVLNSSGNYIVFTDADMAYAMSNLLRVLDKLESGCPIVVGNRRLPESICTVQENALVKYVDSRNRLGTALNFFVRNLFGLTAGDTQSGLKGFHREIAAQIFETVYTDGFLFDIEIFICAKKLGIPIMEIPVHVTYTSDESTVKPLRYFFKLIPELIRIKLLELSGAYDSPTLRESHLLNVDYPEQRQNHGESDLEDVKADVNRGK